jgi:phage baseplate assembly protein W
VEKGEKKLGKDLRLRFDHIGADLVATRGGDFDTVAKEDNLVQAIISRLSTDEGELVDLGHADYGSRLFELMGEVNNATTRQRLKAEVQGCLSQETRIERIVNVAVAPHPKDAHRVDIDITVLPVETNVYLKISYPFRLEG